MLCRLVFRPECQPSPELGNQSLSVNSEANHSRSEMQSQASSTSSKRSFPLSKYSRSSTRQGQPDLVVNSKSKAALDWQVRALHLSVKLVSNDSVCTHTTGIVRLPFLYSRVSLSYVVTFLFSRANSSQKGICVTLSFESSSIPRTQSAGAHQSLAVQLSVLWQDGSQVFEYESIDLNSFGSPLPAGPLRNINAELPLKCAYKDCVAGFRFRVQVKGVRRALSVPS